MYHTMSTRGHEELSTLGELTWLSFQGEPQGLSSPTRSTDKHVRSHIDWVGELRPYKRRSHLLSSNMPFGAHPKSVKSYKLT
ncbi:hypothetical protein BHM03_00022888 [Ensete ventricosum]|nr:hypothetical protein BHM03_00022888 [Ensete ventricosum]